MEVEAAAALTVESAAPTLAPAAEAAEEIQVENAAVAATDSVSAPAPAAGGAAAGTAVPYAAEHARCKKYRVSVIFGYKGTNYQGLQK